jgi:hypothetical protein
VPHLNEVHYAVLYPPAWLPLALGYDGLAWMALLHLLLAGTGMLLYLAALGRTRAAALLGALAFLASAWLTARLHSFPVAGASVWLPWVLWGLERAAQATGPPGATGARRPAAAPLPRRGGAGPGALLPRRLPQVTLLIAATAVFFELGRASPRCAAACRGCPPPLAPLPRWRWAWRWPRRSCCPRSTTCATTACAASRAPRWRPPTRSIPRCCGTCSCQTATRRGR